jgi:hypothetical protein
VNSNVCKNANYFLNLAREVFLFQNFPLFHQFEPPSIAKPSNFQFISILAKRTKRTKLLMPTSNKIKLQFFALANKIKNCSLLPRYYIRCDRTWSPGYNFADKFHFSKYRQVHHHQSHCKAANEL